MMYMSIPLLPGYQRMKEALDVVSRTRNQPLVYSLCEWGWVRFFIVTIGRVVP